jgi:hypothetical protein
MLATRLFLTQYVGEVGGIVAFDTPYTKSDGKCKADDRLGDFGALGEPFGLRFGGCLMRYLGIGSWRRHDAKNGFLMRQ